MEFREELHNSRAAHTGSLQSNFPHDLPPAKDRKEREFYAIDVDNETVSQTNDPNHAGELAKAFKGTVRHVVVNEKSLRIEAEGRRTRYQVGDFSHI